MTQPEFLSWMEFYRLYPFDDFHRIHRPAALVAASMSGDLQARLDWLQPDPREADMTEADVATLRAFGYKGKGG
jgi:hypothetical protein